MAFAVGIDLGTTYSAIAAVDETGNPALIKNAEGNDLTPSVVYLGGAEPVVGTEAKALQSLGDPFVASFFKRVMGVRNWIFFTPERSYTQVELSSFVLRKLKADAEDALGQTVTHAVITVPHYFTDPERRNTIKAGNLAGLEVLRIINEPTAAAIAYGVQPLSGEQTLLVYDLGGGTFDVSLVTVTDKAIDVLATDGNHELGGKNWDDAVLRYVVKQFSEEHGIDPQADKEVKEDLLVQAERVKKTLSTTSRATFVFTYEGKTGRYELTREKFEHLTESLIARTLSLAENVLSDAGLNWAALDGVLCVGGSTRMPAVQCHLTEKTGKALLTGIHVDEAVALGAAIQAGRDMRSTSSLPEPDPRKQSLAPPREINDVMSHSLGMVAENPNRSRYVNSVLIAKNQSIPSNRTRPYKYQTRAGGPNEVEVYILQGESERPLDCTILNKYRFFDIPHNPECGIAVIDMTYSYDRNGVVQVEAVEQRTGQKLRGDIEPVPDDMSWLDEAPSEHDAVGHMSVVIAIDLSGSMTGTPLEEAQSAAKERFVSKMDLAHASIGLIGFSDSVQVVQSLCQNSRQLFSGIDALPGVRTGIGNCAEPFSQAHALLSNVEGFRVVIVLTDGVWADQPRAISEAKKCHDDSIEVVAMGFGSADRQFLEAVASIEEGALLTDLSNLGDSFDRVAKVLTEQSSGMLADADGRGRGALRFFK